MKTHILLISCNDEIGIVARVTGLIFQHGLNVIRNGEFVEQEASRFFMRTEVDGDFDESELLNELRSCLPPGAGVRIAEKREKRIIVFATREPHCLGDLLVQCAFNNLNAEILSVVSNHDHLGSLVKSFGYPFHHIPHQGLSREEHEKEILERIEPYQADYLVLAKYMRILTPEFVTQYQNRIVNIHHSFLPAFVGANPYNQAFQRGVKIIGATAHFVNDGLDEGPIIAQNIGPIDHQFGLKEIVRTGHNIEKMVLARALHLVLTDRVFVSGNKTIISN